ncbi:hypothetical protein [Ruegeria marina]|nr:hypothetical protein [Ruegeria marina]
MAILGELAAIVVLGLILTGFAARAPEAQGVRVRAGTKADKRR